MAWAITRAIPSTFQQAIAMERQAIDVALARRQHSAYVAALRSCGLEVDVLPADDALPDCCFVEDCALIAGGRALVTHPGAPSRVAERVVVRAALERRGLEIVETTRGTLDGGDCMIAGTRIFVGLSRRTNEDGIASVRSAFPDHEVVTIPVREGLHLKSVCSYLGRGKMLLAEGTLPRDAFRGLDVIAVPSGEAPGSNGVSVSGFALVASGFPRTLAAVKAAGFEAIPVDTSEIRKADGALTCMSLLG